jgi:hypothetical protein
MAKKSSRRLTDQERAERRRQDRERLQHAAEQLLTSEGWTRWVRVRSQAGLAVCPSLSGEPVFQVAQARTVVAGDMSSAAQDTGLVRFVIADQQRRLAIPARQRDLGC